MKTSVESLKETIKLFSSYKTTFKIKNNNKIVSHSIDFLDTDMDPEKYYQWELRISKSKVGAVVICGSCSGLTSGRIYYYRNTEYGGLKQTKCRREYTHDDIEDWFNQDPIQTNKFGRFIKSYGE